MSTTNRRQFLRTGMAGAAALGVGVPSRFWTVTQAAGRVHKIKLGVASYSLRKFNRQEAIQMMRVLQAKYICVKSAHLRYKDSPEKLMAGRKEFEAAGLQIVGGGTITMRKDSDKAIRAYFEYARLCGMPLMVIAPKPKVLPRIEKFVKEYDIKVAVHNHGPEDKYFPTPNDVLAVIDGMDPRVGCCVDVGHVARTGADVVESIAEAGDRVLDIHMKDLAAMKKRGSQVPVGEGKMPVAAIFKQLAAINYQGAVNLEYEISPKDPLPGMMQSFAYMRRVRDSLNL